MALLGGQAAGRRIHRPALRAEGKRLGHRAALSGNVLAQPGLLGGELQAHPAEPPGALNAAWNRTGILVRAETLGETAVPGLGEDPTRVHPERPGDDAPFRDVGGVCRAKYLCATSGPAFLLHAVSLKNYCYRMGERRVPSRPIQNIGFRKPPHVQTWTSVSDGQDAHLGAAYSHPGGVRSALAPASVGISWLARNSAELNVLVVTRVASDMIRDIDVLQLLYQRCEASTTGSRLPNLCDRVDILEDAVIG